MITLKDVLTRLDGELLTPGVPLDLECPKVFASDLMSDVLTSAEPGSFLLTGLANAHVVCTCLVADLAAVVFVQGKRPDAGVIEQARAKSLPLIATRLPMFLACSEMAVLLKGKDYGR
jgi:hypothetical protein